MSSSAVPLCWAAFGIIRLSVQSIPPSVARLYLSEGRSIVAEGMSPDHAIASTASPEVRSVVYDWPLTSRMMPSSLAFCITATAASASAFLGFAGSSPR